MVDTQHTTALIEKASALIDTGQAVAALAIYNQIIQLDPSNAEAWLMKGALAGEAGQINEASSAIEHALKLDPSYTDAHLTLGNLQQATGRLPDALKSFQAAVDSAPWDPDARFQLASLLARMGRDRDAYEHAVKAAELDPEYFEVWQLLGWLQQRLGKRVEAEQSYRKALKLSPDNTDLHGALGSLLATSGKHQESIKYLEPYAQAHPGDVESQNNLGAALMGAGRIEEAEKTLSLALTIKPDHAGANANMGVALQYSGQIKGARKYLEKAVNIDPGRPDLHYQLAGVLSGLGEFETALTHCQRAVQLDPKYSDAIAGQAEIHQKRGEYREAFELIKSLLDNKPVNIQAAIIHASISKHIETGIDSIALLETILELQQPTKLEQIQIDNALGKLYDRAGKYDQAFEHFSRSNATKKSSYNPTEHEQFVSEIIETFSTGQEIPISPTRSDIPIFIVGMPRSGTTLVEQILASHPALFGGGEFLGIMKALEQPSGTRSTFPQYVPTLTSQLVGSLSTGLLRHMQASAPNASRIIINERPSYLFLGLLKQIFPGARFIHCVRNPLDNCLSCYFQLLTSEHSYAYKLEHLGHYYKQYQRLMQHWENVLKARLFTITYEELVNNQQSITQALIEFCDLPWDDNCLRFHENKRNVVTPSYDDVRQPIYTTSISRWKNYERYIQPLLTAINSETPDLA